MLKHRFRSANLVLIIFFLLFVGISLNSMVNSSFHDFDEAHRAEGARNMRLHNFFIAPVVGGPYNRCASLDLETDVKLAQSPYQSLFRVPYSQDNSKTLCAVTGRPPLVFNAMAVSSRLFGDHEWAYRLPSFVAGLLGIVIVIIFIKKFNKDAPQNNQTAHTIALILAILVFLTSYDWWLSMQMAHLDTAVSVFTAGAVLVLVLFIQQKRRLYLIVSGVLLGLAIMSKGQPAVLFLAPLPYLLISKKLTLKEIGILFLTTFVTLLPWLIPLSLKFGPLHFIQSYLSKYLASPGSTKLGNTDRSQMAPVYWYLRWWLDSMRPGFVLFSALSLYNIIQKKLNWQKISLLFYILATLALFSYANSKVWWYVLPALPAIVGYLYLSIKDYLENQSTNLINLLLVVVIASLPILRWQSNTVALAYGGGLILVSSIILNLKVQGLKLKQLAVKHQSTLLATTLAIALYCFSTTFPLVNPPFPEAKTIGQFYQGLDQPRCLWLDPDLHYESFLYYTQAGRVEFLTEESTPNPECNNYFLSEQNLDSYKLLITVGKVNFYQLSSLTPLVND